MWGRWVWGTCPPDDPYWGPLLTVEVPAPVDGTRAVDAWEDRKRRRGVQHLMDTTTKKTSNRKCLIRWVEVINKVPEGTFDVGASGQFHGPYKDLEKHPLIRPHRKRSIFGESYLARLDGSGLFTWVVPVAGGVYVYTNPVFRVSLKEQQ